MNYFITGGSRGIGAHLVEEAVALGHDVAFTWVSAEAQAHEVAAKACARRSDARIRCYRLDVKDPDAVESVVDQALDEFDSIDVLVNNAGVTRDNALVSMADEEWEEVIATNLTGPFYMCRQILPVMMSNRFGRVVNISSLVAGGGSGQANYAASKAGLHGLTQTIAKEYGRKGITANTVLPGFFETDMTREHLPDHIRSFWQTWCPVPKGRTGELSELGSVIHFLASEAASYVNGQEIRVTGGLDWGP